MPNPDNPYGVTIGLNPSCGNAGTNYAFWTNLFADMATLGLTWLRFQLSWCSIQLNQADLPAVWSWGPIDDAVTRCNAQGINILLTIRGAPTWALALASQKASTEPWYLPNSNATTDTNSMAYFAQQMATRYNGLNGHGTAQGIGYNEDFSVHHVQAPYTEKLNQAVNNGTVYSSIAVLATKHDLQSGAVLTFGTYGGSGQQFQVTAFAAQGATSLSISAVGGGTFTANQNYTSGSTIAVTYFGIINSVYSEYNGLAGIPAGATVEPARGPETAAPVVVNANPAILAAASGMKRGLPCLWWRNHPNTYDFINGLYVGGVTNSMYDFADYHHYSNNADPMLHGTGTSYQASFDQEWTDINAAQVANGGTGKPIWVTEFGWQVPTDCDEPTQNSRYAAVYNSALASNGIVQKMFFFTLDYKTTGMSQSSLVQWNGSSYTYRQAFTTLKNFIANNPTFPTPYQDYDKSAVIFRNGQSKIIMR